MSANEDKKKNEVSEWCERIEGLYSESPWFKSVAIEHDDGGAHLVVKVCDMKGMNDDNVVIRIDGIKTCIILVTDKPNIPTKK